MQVVSKRFAIGIDLGATAARVGAVDDGGRISAARRFPTRCIQQADTLYAAIKDAVLDLQTGIAQIAVGTRGASGACVPIGLAIPGTLDADRERVIRCVNLPCLESRCVADEAAETLKRPVQLLTDAEAAAWGEYQAQAACGGPPHRTTDSKVGPPGPVRFGHLRVGTGIAFGVVADGELLRIDSDRAQHLETLVVDHGPDAPQCNCGRRGCLEALASGRALERIARQMGIESGLGGLSDAVRRHNPAAADLMARTVEHLCSGARRLSDVFHLERLVLGGGVMEYFPELLDAMIGRVQGEKPIGEHGSPLSIEGARLGDMGGVVGAALLALEAVEGQRSS